MSAEELKLPPIDIDQGFNELHLKKKEAALLGEMLVEIFETERVLDLFISAWAVPFFPYRRTPLSDELVIYTPYLKKVDMVEKHKLLEATTISDLRKLWNKRNPLAHPRAESRNLTEELKDEFVKKCSKVRKEILVKAKEVIKEVTDEVKRRREPAHEPLYQALLKARNQPK